MADGFVPIFSPAGPAHRAGAVPDPGANTPADYVLRADATWGAPASGAGHMQNSLVSLTIAVGEVEANSPAVFAPAFAGVPQVWLTGDKMETLLFATGATAGGATVHAALAVPAIAAFTVDVNVLAVYGGA